MPFTAEKLYYKIRDVCAIVGVPAHVLRFWETEFPSLNPPKSKSGQRTYRPEDIELLLRIRRLLYDEGFTIAGARKQLGMKSRPGPEPPPVCAPRPGTRRRPQDSGKTSGEKPDRLKKVRSELENILTLLDRG